jgi:hypothetical protein
VTLVLALALSSTVFGRAEGRTLDAGLLRGLYLDLLGRPPLEAERAAWLGKDLAQGVDALLQGREFWEHWSEEQLYYFLLIDNFRPEADRVLAIPEDLHRGAIGVREALHRIVLSASFDQRNPGPDTFVTVVMEQLLGTTVQKEARELESGKRLYDGEPGTFLGQKGASQADVVRIAIEQRDCILRFLEREYRRILRADPPEREVGGWARRLDSEPLAYGALVRDWLASPAYRPPGTEKIPQPNRLYVRVLYTDLMGRAPQAEEERRMRAALDGLADPGPLRSVLARLLLDSGAPAAPDKAGLPDSAAWIRGLFERLYGRAPDESELAAFESAFADPECRTATVVYALVSHPEYPTY